MRKIYLAAIFGILLSCLQLSAQQLPCNAGFQFIANNLQVQFSPAMLGDSSTSHHQWFFGDGTGAQTPAPLHAYSTGGTYTVKHVFTRFTSAGAVTCTDTSWQVVVLQNNTLCNLQANFSVTPIPGNWQGIVFQNISIGAAATDTVRWTFGDGTPPIVGQTVTHLFANAGTYNVCVRISRQVPAGAAPCVRELCKTVVITNPAAICNLQAAFVFHRDSSDWRKYFFNNTSVNFLPSDSIRWTFGDGTSAVGVTNPYHIYTQAGTYNVCLRVKRVIPSSNTPCVSEICSTITVVAPSNNLCNLGLANFTFYRSTANWKHLFFTNTTANLLPTDSIKWTFGDNSPAVYTVNANHLYTQAGTYNVCLRIKRNIPGTTVPCVKEICKVVTVDSIPASTVCGYFIDFNSRVDSLNHLKVYFNNLAYQLSGAIATWSFGDGTYGSGWNVNHTYTTPGLYNVCLRIQYPNGCVREKCRVIQIPPPTVGTTCILQPYPNPAQNQVSISLSLGQPMIIYSRIFNSANVIVRQQQQNGIAGMNTVSFNNISNLPAGLYRIVVHYGSHECRATFAKY